MGVALAFGLTLLAMVYIIGPISGCHVGANGYGAHSPTGYGLVGALVAEVVLTALLVLIVLGATDAKFRQDSPALQIGLVLTLIHLVGIPITNTSVNPARSFGPAIFVGDWALSQLWVFVLAPVAGALLAVAVYRAIRQPEAQISAREAEQALRSEQAERYRQATEGVPPTAR